MSDKQTPRAKRECELVRGTWYEYFNKITTPVFTDAVCKTFCDQLERLYGNFFDRNLSPDKGYLLSLGAGFGATEIPLARKGYKVIGIDNDRRVLDLLRSNAERYGMGRVTAVFGDLYEDFHHQFVGQGIQACVSFGVLEHFAPEDLKRIIEKQFSISPLMICMMPIRTPETLRTFGAEKQPEGHIDENGIYRNFWSPEFWETAILGRYNVVDNLRLTNHSRIGQIDMMTYAVRSDRNPQSQPASSPV